MPVGDVMRHAVPWINAF